MDDGLYVVEFETPLGTGSGVVSMRQNKFAGGDSGMIYRGTITATDAGSEVTATVTFGRHTHGLPSVLGIDAGQVELTGHGDSTQARLSGSAKEAPNVRIGVKVRRCGDL